jgi:hypothetical protein
MSLTDAPEATATYAIVYLRPDGWWLAGDGFDDEAEAQAAGEKHDWRGSTWKTIPSAALEATLCDEALESLEEDADSDDER